MIGPDHATATENLKVSAPTTLATTQNPTTIERVGTKQELLLSCFCTLLVVKGVTFRFMRSTVISLIARQYNSCEASRAQQVWTSAGDSVWTLRGHTDWVSLFYFLVVVMHTFHPNLQ